MSIIDDIKKKFSSSTGGEKKLEVFPYPDSVDMQKFFYEHANDKSMQERDNFYESLKISYLAQAKRGNWHDNFTNDPNLEWHIYMPNYATRHMLKNVADNYRYGDTEEKFVALKSCLDFVMQKGEVEPWVVWKELAEFKRYQYDGGGNIITERVEMLANGMRYMGENGFLADEKKLRDNITSYNNEMGWDQALREGETHEQRQAGIDEGIERAMAEVMDIQKPYEKKMNNLMGKIVQIRDDATKTDSNDNKPKL
jgi:hypothetical protein